MTAFFVLAHAPGASASGPVGVPLTGLIGSLGAAGAAVIVTLYFLSFLKDQGEKQGRMYQDFKEFHTNSQKKLQEQVDRLTDRHMQSQRTFQDQISRITDAQNALLREAVLAMKSVEKTLESSTDTMRSVEKMTASLKTSVVAIDDLVRFASDSRKAADRSSSGAPPLKSGAAAFRRDPFTSEQNVLA
jgi:methyl-accepting chemotaxis protein